MNPNQSVPLIRPEHADEYRRFKTTVNAVAYGTVGWLAGKHFYDRYLGRVVPEALLGASIRHGVLCAIRWKVWVFTAVSWLLLWPILILCATGVFDTVFDEPGYRGIDIEFTRYTFGSLTNARLMLLLHLALGVFAVGATYVQCVRLSEFKRRWFYWATLPFETVVRWVPWFLLHSLVVTPIIIVWSYWSYR